MRNTPKIKELCEGILSEHVENRPNWVYLKSKKSFVRKVSKSSFVDIYTGMSPKVDFVKFQFSIHAGHKLIGEADSFRKGINWAVTRNASRWSPVDLARGRCTVYDHEDSVHRNGIFEENRAQNKGSYVRLSEFPDWLLEHFSLAEKEISNVFDTSSEKALIQSIIDKPIGFFRPNEVLLVQLLLGNCHYYEELLEFYSQPVETIQELTREAFNQPAAEKLVTAYKNGDLPRFRAVPDHLES